MTFALVWKGTNYLSTQIMGYNCRTYPFCAMLENDLFGIDDVADHAVATAKNPHRLGRMGRMNYINPQRSPVAPVYTSNY